MKANNFQLRDFPITRKNYYEILGLPAYTQIKDIKEEYRKLARYCLNNNFIEEFSKINEAYHFLSNPEDKIIYDNFLRIKDKESPLIVAINKSMSSIEQKALRIGHKLIRYAPTRKEIMKMHEIKNPFNPFPNQPRQNSLKEIVVE